MQGRVESLSGVDVKLSLFIGSAIRQSIVECRNSECKQYALTRCEMVIGLKAMMDRARNISLFVDEKEMVLLNEACLYAADADENIETAVKEKGGYRIYLSYDELDDLADSVAERSNNEESSRKQDQWDTLCDKIENLLKFNEPADAHSDPPRPVPKLPALKYYIFDIWIKRGRGVDATTKVLRRIQLAEKKSLYNFAKVIIQAFGFYFDHCFGFYDNFERYHDSQKAYELFFDIGEEPLSPNTKGVKKTKINQAFKHPGDKMLFFFDYGDSWYFAVELKEIRQAQKWDLKPVILESIGKAPLQYPPLRGR
jgi:hypothetical protein